MKELKLTTLDETILIVIKDYGTPKEKRRTCASLIELFQKPVEKQSEIELPSQEELLYASPGKKRPLSKTFICMLCGIKYDDKRDKEYKSPWMGCNVTGCDVWQHTRCKGLIMPKPLKDVEMDMSISYGKTAQASVGDETKKVIFCLFYQFLF